MLRLMGLRPVVPGTLNAEDVPTALEVLKKAIYAYEEVLSKKNGKCTRATRTWQMIQRHRILEAVERAVNRSSETAGYRALQEMGQQDFAFEAVILRYPELFSADAVQRSKDRIAQ